MGLVFKVNRLLRSPGGVLVYPIIFSPISWLLGFNLFFYHAISIYIFLRVYRSGGRKYFPLALIFLVLYSVMYLISIIIVSPGEDFSRILASMYNWSYWLMGCLLIYAVANSESEVSLPHIYEGIAKIILGLSVLGVVLYLVSGVFGELRVPSILGLFLPLGSLPPLISDSFSLNLLSVDWFAGDSVPRMSLLAPYPTAFAMSVIGLLFFSFTKRFSWVLVVACGFLIYMSLSRMVMVFYILSLLFAIFLSLEPSVRRLTFTWGLVLVLLVLPFVAHFALVVWDEFNSVRQASSDMRVFLYQHSVETVLEERPLLGMGVKSRGELLIPLGSHSTIVGAFYKTGFLGSIFLYLFYLASVFGAVLSMMYMRRDVAYIGALVLLFSVYSMFEDMDAPQLVAYMFFLSVGLLCRYSRHKFSR